ncbi:cysteine--tRNA ligase [Anaerolinea thermophila]|uniref:Cysteine--tRNA ligase n=1 Tax=Anaerolinea thermophila (strain DSM 14523 / JCM 11388 / NBRC 100420 / UNI-1) TaxID=926569 RepID=E8N2T2_ANATU|nr:cysteine--tRNA ligase [Anaerolinea thermophila]BAJ65082.1 cysteinyl-tRNA synthetase [Anaerolinea thermophila UNI-1]
MALKIYNTLTRKKEPFETLEPGKVRMYVCGPTVYNKAHVGHAMSALVFDIIRRYLEYRGYQVKHAMNYTDVDDKIILRASQLGMDPFALAETYIQEYRKNLEDLNVLPATINPRATQEIDQIIAIIQGLIEKGYAYPAPNGDVYFRVTRDEDYGRLSGRKLDEMQAGARIEVGEQKEHPMDFALWKAAKPGEPAWDSPWGKGRPGWHIECSAMNLHHLGEQIDIHGGGNDLIFPHHENEIAQSESYTGKPFARYWVHNGMLQFGGEKMSKSLGNLVTIEEFLARHDADVLRLMVLNSGYRAPLTFNDDVIEQTERALERLKSALRPALPGAAGISAEAVKALEEQARAARAGFEEAMDDDFNTAGALSHLFELVRAINSARTEGATDEQLRVGQDVLRELAGVLGLRLRMEEEKPQEAAPFIDLLIEVRTELRKQKLWALSDLIRDRLTALGVTLEDTREGTTWRYQK